MKTIALLVTLLIGFSAFSQEIHNRIQGEYENPHIEDIIIKGYELTYGGNTYLYKSETDNLGDNYVTYSSTTIGEKIFIRVTRNNKKYLELDSENYILIRKVAATQETERTNADAIMGGFSDSNGKAEGGEGNDQQAGDKGKAYGDPNASGYFGVGGDGSGGNYRLSNRNALNKPKPDYPCNEEGKVVVTISVDQSGRVISAQPGAKGTTTSAPCLFTEAKEAALKTKFNADSKAPSKQVGTIIYNFNLTD
jgi:hypothetical protein